MSRIASDHRNAAVLSLLLLICLRSVHHWLENRGSSGHSKQYSLHQVQPCDLCESPTLPVETLDISLPVLSSTAAEAMPVVEELAPSRQYYPKRGPPGLIYPIYFINQCLLMQHNKNNSLI